ncbi:hypothetical protein JO972_12085 [Verrucomicrobiaceae bacterium 5K15]|uniref:Uncharacterized protein n=1 Tax=Oceaniferula flava TaxID=2800421 RepID=A0AAE2V9T8_9BACT|nr:hypothetical protein [Oceaniferula flavus]MBK1855703.1 hypothetical protein [Oceaniferula flavus]MBM1137009.1 hypothetical protein [Oceaniferula flavus]
MIYFKDFRPAITGQEKVLFMTVSNYDGISEVMPKVNEWVARNKIEPINIETVVLPNIDLEEGRNDSHLRASGEMSTHWFQVVRVWYQVEDGRPIPSG